MLICMLIQMNKWAYWLQSKKMNVFCHQWANLPYATLQHSTSRDVSVAKNTRLCVGYISFDVVQRMWYFPYCRHCHKVNTGISRQQVANTFSVGITPSLINVMLTYRSSLSNMGSWSLAGAGLGRNGRNPDFPEPKSGTTLLRTYKRDRLDWC